MGAASNRDGEAAGLPLSPGNPGEGWGGGLASGEFIVGRQTTSLALPRSTGRGDQRAPAGWSSSVASRANNFDAIRLGLAIAVIVSHAWPIVYGREHFRREMAEPLFYWTNGQMVLGGVAVNGFFAISGYLIAASFAGSRSTGDYLAKRARRIYPGYLLAIAVSLVVAAVCGAGWHFSAIDAGKRLMATGLLREVIVPSAMRGNPLPGVVNGSLWTIQYEFYCYLLVIVLGGLVVRGQGKTLALLAAATAVLAAVVSKTEWDPDWGWANVLLGRPSSWPRLLSHFLAGMAFFGLRDRVPHRGTLAIAAVLLLVIAARVQPVLLLVSPLAMTYLVMWLAFHPRVRLHGVARFGDFSFGVYLYAFLVQQVLVYAGVTATPMGNIAASVPIAVLCGVASWHGCEKWFVRKRGTLLGEDTQRIVVGPPDRGCREAA